VGDHIEVGVAPAGAVAGVPATGRGLAVVVTATRDPAANLALEEALLAEVERGERPDTLRLWVADACLVRGPNRSATSGWHHDAEARRLGLSIHTRTSGGGTVYFDHGNLNWSFYLRRAESFVAGRRLFPACAAVIAVGLRALGITATFAPPNRLDVAGRKISGMASKANLGAVLVHGTLLVSTDLERLNAVCIRPPGCPPVVNLCDFDPDLTVARVRAAIARSAVPPEMPSTQ
jgi:lipoate-protein ligase A